MNRHSNNSPVMRSGERPREAMRVAMAGLGICLFFSSCSTDREAAKWKARRVRPYGDVVPDRRTAIQIAEAVMSPVYGRRYVIAQRPQIAELRDDVWYVHGYMPPNSAGGTIEAYIDKHTGRVLAITDGGE